MIMRRDFVDCAGEPALYHVLAARSRGASDRALTIEAIAGVGGAVIVVVFTPAAWVAAGAFGALASFAVWGLIDHVLMRSSQLLAPSTRGGLLATQCLAAALGTVACVTLIFWVAGQLMGTFIS